MKFKAVFFVFIFSMHFSFSQRDTERLNKPEGYLAILLGPALPLGDYADNGLAKTGINGEVSLHVPIIDHFGVCGMYKYVFNPVNVQSIIPGVRGSNQPTISSTPWKIHNGLAGIYYSFNLSPSSAGDESMYLDIRGAGGISYITSPDVTIVLANPGHTTSELSSDNTLQFSYLFSAGFRKKIGDVVFKAGIDYLGTRATFQNITVSYGSQMTAAPPVSQNISILLLNIGICVRP